MDSLEGAVVEKYKKSKFLKTRSSKVTKAGDKPKKKLVKKEGEMVYRYGGKSKPTIMDQRAATNYLGKDLVKGKHPDYVKKALKSMK